MQIDFVISQLAALSALSCTCDLFSVTHCACLRLRLPCSAYNLAATPQAQRHRLLEVAPEWSCACWEFSLSSAGLTIVLLNIQGRWNK